MAETWLLNATITLPPIGFSAAFTSNGMEFTSIRVSGAILYYSGTKNIKVYTRGSWANSGYRTLVFDPAPTGDLLTWLQANGVKQSDPEPETPTNSCMVDGTVYGIKTGTALVNGTARTIYNGRTLVDGAGYNIVLSTSGFTVTIEGNGEDGSGPAKREYAAVVINGTAYASAETVEVESSTAITLRTSGISANTKIEIDGVTVAQGTTAAAASYTYTPTGDITVTLRIKYELKGKYGVITVTTN